MATIISKFVDYIGVSKTVSDFVVLGITADHIPYVRYKYSSMNHPSIRLFDRVNYYDALAIARDHYNRKVMFLLAQI